MVGGRNYDESPFNLATEGERQPGSSFKAFDLAAALEHGISPDSVWPSKEKTFYVPSSARRGKVRRPQRRRRLHGREHAHQRDRLLRQLDLRRSRPERSEPHKIARLAHEDGDHDAALDQPRDDDRRPDVSASPRSTWPTPTRRSPTAASASAARWPKLTPRSASRKSKQTASPLPDGSKHDTNTVETKRVLPLQKLRPTETSVLETVLQYGTGQSRRARRIRRRQDRDDLQLRRRLVRRLEPPEDGRGLGRLPQGIPMTTDFNGGPSRAAPSGDHLARLHGLGAWDRKGTRRTRGAPQGLFELRSAAGTSSTGEAETSAPSTTVPTDAEPECECSTTRGRRQGRREIRQGRRRQRSDERNPQGRRRTRTHRRTGAGNTHAGIPVRPILAGAIHAGVGARVP